MKKIILFALLASLGLTNVSCSGDDSPQSTTTPVNEVPQVGGTISFKIDGVQKTFNTFTIDPEEIDGVMRLTVGAYSDTNPHNEWLEFTVNHGVVGQNKITSFVYYDLEGEIGMYTTNVMSNITVNTSNDLFDEINTLTGTLSAISVNPDHSVTEGTFTFVH
jgi:hypothetical protein